MTRDQIASQWLTVQDGLIRRCNLCDAQTYRVARCSRCVAVAREARLNLAERAA